MADAPAAAPAAADNSAPNAQNSDAAGTNSAAAGSTIAAGDKPADGAPAAADKSGTTDSAKPAEGDKPKEGEKPKEGDKPKDGDKPKEGEKPADDKPIEYKDFTLPEGFEAVPELIDKVKAFGAEMNLPQEKAQVLVDLGTELAKTISQRNVDLWTETNTNWQKDVEKDTEIGGANLPKTQANIAKVLADPRFGGGGETETAIREALFYTGAGNNPAIVRLLARLSAAVTEGTHVGGNPSGKDAPKTPGETVYGKPSTTK